MLGIQEPRTHDLKTLAMLIPMEHGLPLRLVELVELNPFAVDIRYADDWREPRLGDAKRAFWLASEIPAAVRELLPPPVVI